MTWLLHSGLLTWRKFSFTELSLCWTIDFISKTTQRKSLRQCWTLPKEKVKMQLSTLQCSSPAPFHSNGQRNIQISCFIFPIRYSYNLSVAYNCILTFCMPSRVPFHLHFISRIRWTISNIASKRASPRDAKFHEFFLPSISVPPERLHICADYWLMFYFALRWLKISE